MCGLVAILTKDKDIFERTQTVKNMLSTIQHPIFFSSLMALMASLKATARVHAVANVLRDHEAVSHEDAQALRRRAEAVQVAAAAAASFGAFAEWALDAHVLLGVHAALLGSP